MSKQQVKEKSLESWIWDAACSIRGAMDAPHGKIQKFDVSVAKNYLTEPEMAQLSRLVNAYLDLAEDMAQRQIFMTMQNRSVAY